MQKNSPDLWLQNFPFPNGDMHKYDRGYAIVIGSHINTGSTGATKLAALSALRSGAGIVSIICDAKDAPIYANSMLSVMIKIADNIRDVIVDNRVKSVLIGPGNGVNAITKANVLQCLKLAKVSILDADAITVFQNDPNKLFKAIQSDVILTPHLGEFGKIFPIINNNKIDSAINAAKISNATILLKGKDSIIASPNGKYIINEAAPAYLATAGSGDVLAGIITGLMAQGLDSFTAGCIACYIHTEASKSYGFGLIAEDLLAEIPKIVKAIIARAFLQLKL